jgi:hypothetical protein
MLKAYLHPKLVSKQAHTFEIRTKVKPSKEGVKKQPLFVFCFVVALASSMLISTIIHCITSHLPPLPIILK